MLAPDLHHRNDAAHAQHASFAERACQHRGAGGSLYHGLRIRYLYIRYLHRRLRQVVDIPSGLQEEIEKILGQITFTEGRFTVGSPVNYDINAEIQWKDQEKGSVSLSLMENDSLTDILEQLYQQNTD